MRSIWLRIATGLALSELRNGKWTPKKVAAELMPALVERDLEAFGRALTAIDSRTGSYFAKVQGGLYSHAATEDLIALMLSEGAAGAGQSSWGPAVYGVVREPSARRLQERARDFLAARALGEAVFVCHGRNTPAQVEVRREEL